MSYGIRFAVLAGTVGRPEPMDPPPGSWLVRYDPEAFQGRGAAHWDMDPALALRFDTQAAAWELWRRVPRNRPRRPDGQPNRPLTAFTVSIEELP